MGLHEPGQRRGLSASGWSAELLGPFAANSASATQTCSDRNASDSVATCPAVRRPVFLNPPYLHAVPPKTDLPSAFETRIVEQSSNTKEREYELLTRQPEVESVRYRYLWQSCAGRARFYPH